MLDIIIVIIRRRPRDPHQVLRFGLRLQRHRRHRIPPVLHHFLSLSLYLAALSRTPCCSGFGHICRYFVREAIDRDRGAREPPCRGEAGVGAGVGVGVGEGGPQG